MGGKGLNTEKTAAVRLDDVHMMLEGSNKVVIALTRLSDVEMATTMVKGYEGVP